MAIRVLSAVERVLHFAPGALERGNGLARVRFALGSISVVGAVPRHAVVLRHDHARAVGQAASAGRLRARIRVAGGNASLEESAPRLTVALGEDLAAPVFFEAARSSDWRIARRGPLFE